jgi:hypothetical protein
MERNGDVMSMNKTIVNTLLCFILVSMMIMWAGCGTTPRDTSIPDSGPTDIPNVALKKRVLIMPFIDQAGLGGDRIGRMTERFIDLLGQKPHLSVVAASASPAKAGEEPVIEWLKTANGMGMNVLVTATLPPTDILTNKLGLWPLVITKRELEISMIMNAFNVANGTMLLSHLESRKLNTETRSDDLEVLRGEGEIQTESEDPLAVMGESRIQKALEIIVERQVAVFSGVSKEVPWIGRIESVDNQHVLLSVGKDVGLIADVVFEVYEKGDPVQSRSGRTFYPIGAKIGEIKVERVMEKQASAIPLSGAALQPGQFIKLKKLPLATNQEPEGDDQ